MSFYFKNNNSEAEALCRQLKKLVEEAGGSISDKTLTTFKTSLAKAFEEKESVAEGFRMESERHKKDAGFYLEAGQKVRSDKAKLESDFNAYKSKYKK